MSIFDIRTFSIIDIRFLIFDIRFFLLFNSSISTLEICYMYLLSIHGDIRFYSLSFFLLFLSLFFFIEPLTIENRSNAHYARRNRFNRDKYCTKILRRAL